jgi:hypothetical protein
VQDGSWQGPSSGLPPVFHRTSDLFAGAAIGNFTTRFLTRLHKHSRFAILPLLENGRQDLALAYRF